MRSKKLGKGLSALIGESDLLKLASPSKVKASLIDVDINDILPNPDQPRQLFEEKKLLELAESIKSVGIIEPIVVSEEKGKYYLIAGERRWRAAKIAGFSSIPAVIKNDNKNKILEIMLIENIQREDLSPIEEANSYQIILNRKNMTQEELAKSIGKSRVYVTNLLRILKLPSEIQTELNQNAISVGHAKVLVGLNKDTQLDLLKKITQKSLSVREVEALTRLLDKKDNKKQKKQSFNQNKVKEDAHIKALEDKLRDRFKTKVSIKVKHREIGKIEVDYYNYKDLEIILKKMGVI